MVTTHKDMESFRALISKADCGFATQFPLHMMQTAKDMKLFKPMKEFIQQQEEKGLEIHYICTETTDNKKQLGFVVFGDKDEAENTAYGIFNIANQIREFKIPIISTEWVSVGESMPSGTPTCCPYFG